MSNQHTDETSTNMTLAKFMNILSSKLLYFKLPELGLLLIVYAFSFGEIRSCSISCFIRRSFDEKVDRNSSVSKLGQGGSEESVCVNLCFCDASVCVCVCVWLRENDRVCL